MKNRLMSLVMPILPKHALSHWVGRAAHAQLPPRMARASVQAFARAYSIDMDEAEKPLDAYESIGDLFTRRLRPGARPIGTAPVHPCDGLITECGRIEKLQMIQAKGKLYSVPELLRSSRQALAFEGGAYFTYYLCPTDYHRVHNPVDGRIEWSCHVPGELWPVNAWSVETIPHLFSTNERVAAVFATAKGRVAVVMVAATNVGNMQLAFDENFATNALGDRHRAVREHVYDPPRDARAGDEFGVFRMGSTAIVLYEKGMIPDGAFALKGQRSKVGESLISS